MVQYTFSALTKPTRWGAHLSDSLSGSAAAGYGYDELVAVLAARRYYFDDKSKSEIAVELGISRFKVARLLARARDRGIVTISIHPSQSSDEALADALIGRFGLNYAIVLSAFEMDQGVLRDHLGKAAAALLRRIAEPQDILGLGWARSVLACAAHLRGIDVAQVVQLTGALTRPGIEEGSVELVRRVAQLAGATALSFHAPMLVSDATTAAALRQEPQVARAMRAYPQVTKALVGLGGWPSASTLCHEVSSIERAEMLTDSVFADISGVLIDQRGNPVDTPAGQRVIAIDAAMLRAVPEVIAIAYGAEKAPATRAAIQGGYVTSLVTHTELAEHMLGD